MSGVLVVAEARGGELRPVSFELVGAAAALAAQGAGPVEVLVVGADPEALAAPLRLAGVERLLLASSPREDFEPHVSERALAAAIEQRQPAVVLAGHTIDSMGFLAAVAARGRHGFAADVKGVEWDGGAARAERETHGGKLSATLDFPGKETVLLTLRAGAFAAASEPGEPQVETLDVDLADAARGERLELREPPAGDVDITRAEFLLAIGRGVEDEDGVPGFERLAERLGATLCVSRPLVDAGWVANGRQVGQSGRTVAPKVYLAMGVSGAVQHLAGIAGAQTVIAVNTDPEAPIFGAAKYGAVADMFEIAAAIERQLQ